VSQKRHLFFARFSFLFVRPKRNETKKKGAGNENFSIFWQNAFGFTRPKNAEVRAISGLPSRRYYQNTTIFICIR
jgi:hypothetical protein